MIIKGKVWRFGANVDTDAIIPARYMNTSVPEELAKHVMEDADPQFPQKVGQGDIIVADKNFGCGSSREHAPIAIKAAGVAAVIAPTFARIFNRNAINIGLPILESPEAATGIKEGDIVEINTDTGVIKNITTGAEFQAQPFPEFMQKLIAAGGLMAYVKERKKENHA
ncbi:3-isopropylmalate dehydratase small subunit [Dehalobacterium formicoaceticum]|uniref:3-isopropylmalate dehydratase small subunit n=1 Tax=Dehalobacterium formicoaceticum TaxID=51515 RepID=A0ABT1Y0I6_9FIRM|nr:3-isopropylmalate dehydratase small subunit [Dehalobacterium formicoaceticum]MCR6544365.1 3-isopropylmalate dehydratase small subunit [Dehalobacterium formicoaceticum]